MSKPLFLLAASLWVAPLAVPASAAAAIPALVAGPRIPVNPAGSGHHLSAIAAADPESADNLIVSGGRINSRTGSGWEGYVYQSSDGGRTWREVLVDSTSQWVSEESCTFGPGHQAYFAASASDTSRGSLAHEYGELHLYRSPDGGRSWQNILTHHFMDWTSMAVDARPGPEQGTLHIFANDIFNGQGGSLPGDRPYLLTRRELPKPSLAVTSGTWNRGAIRGGLFPQGTAVLRDGTIITIGWAKKRIKGADGKDQRILAVNSIASRDGGKTLEDAVTIWPDYLLSSLAVNHATDQLYVAFSAPAHPEDRHGREGKLMLATSTDEGRTWTTNPVKLPSGEVGDVGLEAPSLAINQAGAIGFMWYSQDDQRAFFGASFDGGASLAQVIPLTPAVAGDPALLLDKAMASYVYNPDPKEISLRLKVQNYPPAGTSLVADKNGAFHPIWSETANGPTELYTRTITVGPPAATPPTLDGLTDVTERCVVHVANVRFDHLGSLVAIDVTVTNKSIGTLSGPIRIALPPMKPGQLQVAADNADNGQTGAGALWELPLPNGNLAGEQSTDPRTLTFKVSTEQFLKLTEFAPFPIQIYARTAP
jgi:hypothetical protein